MAARKGHELAVKILVEEGKAVVNEKNSMGWSALREARLQGHERVATYLASLERAC